MKQIALFGTSADPPTVGHQAIIEWLAERYDAVAVWASDNPFKRHQSLLSARQRMLALLVQDSQQRYPQVQLQARLSHSKTLLTVQQAQQLWPQARLTLVVGADVVPTLPDWYGVATLFQQVQLLILRRPNAQLQPKVLAVLQGLGAQFAIANFQGPPVSSSHYRHTGDIQTIPTVIAAYIQHHHLYSWNESNPPLDPTAPLLLTTSPSQNLRSG